MEERACVEMAIVEQCLEFDQDCLSDCLSTWKADCSYGRRAVELCSYSRWRAE